MQLRFRQIHAGTDTNRGLRLPLQPVPQAVWALFAGANLPKSALEVTGAEHVTWYQASDKVRRGFCYKCGSWLFWEPIFRDWTCISLGSLDGPTGLALERHIFVAHKGDYYTIDDGLPQNDN